MNFQMQEYINEMNKMYDVISKKQNLSLIELQFLEVYKRTISCYIK